MKRSFKVAAVVLAVLGFQACRSQGTDSVVAASGRNVDSHEGTGLNIYCDPIDIMYAGGSPVFDETSGTSIKVEDYLAAKGLNEFCDASDTVYAGS